MGEELKPCAHCGSEVISSRRDGDYWVFQCAQCGAEIAHTQHHKAKAAWNRRTPDADLAAAARDAVEKVGALLQACDRGRLVPKSGMGACGMTIEAQTRASCINGVDAWPVEEAREAVEALTAALAKLEGE